MFKLTKITTEQEASALPGKTFIYHERLQEVYQLIKTEVTENDGVMLFMVGNSVFTVRDCLPSELQFLNEKFPVAGSIYKPVGDDYTKLVFQNDRLFVTLPKRQLLTARQLLSNLPNYGRECLLYDVKIKRLYHLAYGVSKVKTLTEDGDLLEESAMPRRPIMTFYKGEGGYKQDVVTYPPGLDFNRYLCIPEKVVTKGYQFTYGGQEMTVDKYVGADMVSCEDPTGKRVFVPLLSILKEEDMR